MVKRQAKEQAVKKHTKKHAREELKKGRAAAAAGAVDRLEGPAEEKSEIRNPKSETTSSGEQTGLPAGGTVVIEAPVGVVDARAFRPRHFNFHASAEAAAAAKQLAAGLARRHARLNNGRHCETSNDAVKWIMEELARGMAQNGEGDAAANGD